MIPRVTFPPAIPYPDDGRTYWNGEPTPARRVRVVVGASSKPASWCAGLEGQERAAVEVRYGGETFYLDDEDGSGWRSVTTYRGYPQAPYRSLPVARVLT